MTCSEQRVAHSGKQHRLRDEERVFPRPSLLKVIISACLALLFFTARKAWVAFIGIGLDFVFATC